MAVKKHLVVLKEGSQGLLKDGRKFEVIKFKRLAVADDGSIYSGLVGVVIDDKYIEIHISMLARNIDYEHYNSK